MSVIILNTRCTVNTARHNSVRAMPLPIMPIMSNKVYYNLNTDIPIPMY